MKKERGRFGKKKKMFCFVHVKLRYLTDIQETAKNWILHYLVLNQNTQS